MKTGESCYVFNKHQLEPDAEVLILTVAKDKRHDWIIIIFSFCLVNADQSEVETGSETQINVLLTFTYRH